jgi:DMSO/TMAO reductase YedYZ molybdopterin-dependent catalytic subunit
MMTPMLTPPALPVVSRRVFVRAVLAGASGSAASSWLACGGDPTPGARDAGPEVPAELCLPFLTPLDGFFVQAGGRATVADWSMPRLDADSHRITIGGLVAQPVEFGLRELEAATEQHVTVVKTMMCVLGYRACGLFTGVPLRVWLERAQVRRELAVRVRFIGADGFENNLKWSDIVESPDDVFEPLLVFRMGDVPLPVEHGYPVRLLLGDRFGYKNIKWLERIEVSDSDEPTGQYQSRGYPDSGLIEPPVPTVETHRIEQDIPKGDCDMCGYALSGLGGIEAVELAVDGAAFQSAEIVPMDTWRARYPALEASLQARAPERFGAQWRGVWVVWHFRWHATPGEHAIEIRARDRAGGLGTGTTLHLRAS